MENFLRTILNTIKEFEHEPVVYGSFGLSLYLGRHKQEFGDLDILVDDHLLESDWDNFKTDFIKQGFCLQDEKEHEFSLSDKTVGFGKKSNLIRDGIINDYSELVFSDTFGALTLSPENFLKAYMFSQKDGYRRDVRGKKDEETVEKIKNYIKKTKI